MRRRRRWCGWVSKQYLPRILKVASDPNALERYQAIGYLGKMPPEKSLPALMALLGDEEDDTVYYSLKAMGKQVPRPVYGVQAEQAHTK